MNARLLRLTLLAALPACLDVPDTREPECRTTSDCQGAEVCESGTCWGDPPSGEFAVVVSPPTERTDLVTREMMNATITSDGVVQGLAFERPITLIGQLDPLCTPPIACERRALQASVTVARASLFAGGPGFKAVAQVSPSDEVSMFRIDVPPGDDEHPYTVTVVPMPRGDAPSSMASLAESVPPMRYSLALPVSATKRLTIGGVNLPTIDGTLLEAGGGGLADYRVVAMGRWDANAALTEVSTVAYTTSNGAFHLTLSPDLVGPVEIVARPSDGSAVKPTLRLVDVVAQSQSFVQKTLSEPALGAPGTRTVRLRGKADNGELRDVVGARVRATATVGDPLTGLATYVDEATTDDNGAVVLDVREGATYRIDVVPPASAQSGVLYDYPLDGSNLTIQLPRRTRLTGSVRSFAGDPLPGVTVTARPSLRFVWSLDALPQAFLNAIPAATVVTDDRGEYVLYVDPAVGTTWGFYDISLDPARSTGFLERTPTWIYPSVAIPEDASAAQVNVEAIWLPDAAFVHGPVVDFDGAAVTDAEVKVFRTRSDAASVCEVRNAPTPCPVPAELLGRGVTDAEGVVELTLPR